MGTRLYVGNLPFDVDESQIRTLFQEGGREVAEVKIVMDRDTGRPRGFAFVEMTSQADAQAAIQAMNGREVGGRADSGEDTAAAEVAAVPAVVVAGGASKPLSKNSLIGEMRKICSGPARGPSSFREEETFRLSSGVRTHHCPL
jgi:RNA recognition motif-containing protein